MAKSKPAPTVTIDDIIRRVVHVRQLVLDDIRAANSQSKSTPLALTNDILETVEALLDVAHRLWVPFDLD